MAKMLGRISLGSFCSCCNGHPFWPRRMKRRERRQVDGEVFDALAVAPEDPYVVDPSDCRHGCNGDCVAREHAYATSICSFTCHTVAVEAVAWARN